MATIAKAVILMLAITFAFGAFAFYLIRKLNKPAQILEFWVSMSDHLKALKATLKRADAHLKAIDRLKKDPRVDSISDERSFGDGYFVYLKAGYCISDDDTCHTIHEYSIAECLKQLQGVRAIK